MASLVFLLFLAPFVSGAHATITADSLSAFIQEKITALEATPETGVAVAVIKDGKLFLAKGFGLKDRAKRLPVTPQTLFGIGSTTKAFTGAGLMMLKEWNKLSLSKPVIEYLPDFAMKDPVATREMTSEDLMTHRSGLPRHDLLWYFSPFSRRELYQRLKYLDPNPHPEFQFRKGFQYNNLMVMTAGILLEKISGLSWEKFVTEHIFDKLKMSRTQAHLRNVLEDLDRALPYFGKNEIPYKDTESIGPAGSLYSSAADMAKWLEFLLREGVTEDGERLLSRDGVADLFKARIYADFGSAKLGYGLGWVVPENADSPLIPWHNGNVDGFSAHVSLYPDKQMGVVILTNETAERKITAQLTDLIYLKLLGLEGSWRRPLFTTRAANLDFPNFAASVNSHRLWNSNPLAIPSGNFRNAGYGPIEVIHQVDAGYANYFGNQWAIEDNGGKPAMQVKLFGGFVSYPIPIRESSDKKGIEIDLEPSATATLFERED